LLKPLAPGAVSPQLLRPLLDFPRAALAEYAGIHGLRWIEDESNLDNHLKRNFLRNEVLPVLRQGFPAPAETLARAASHQAAAARLLDVLADIDLSTAGLLGSAQIGIAALLELSDERLKNALRRWLDRAALRQPSTARLNALIRALRESSNDTRLTWEHEGVRLVRRKGLLELQRV
jgi:tRNA(Ile)-lysidine synthase